MPLINRDKDDPGCFDSMYQFLWDPNEGPWEKLGGFIFTTAGMVAIVLIIRMFL